MIGPQEVVYSCQSLRWIHLLCSLCISPTQQPGSGRGRLVARRPPFPAPGPHERFAEFYAATPLRHPRGRSRSPNKRSALN